MKILERYSYNITRAGILITLAVSNTVVAQVDDALAPITEFICSVGTALSGPIAIAIGLVLIAAGGIAIAVGGRRAMGTVLWGIVGITVATSAVALTASLLGEGTCGEEEALSPMLKELYYAKIPQELSQQITISEG